MSANDRTGVGAGSAEWGTPPELFARLNRRFCFDYDAFASHENQLIPAMQPSGRASWYSTATGTWGQYAGRRSGESYLSGCFPIHDADGLEFSWADRRVFMNPPYSRDLIAKCVRKAVDERKNAEIIVALLPAATETAWFQQLVFPYCHIDWLPKRVRYIDPVTKQPGQSPPSGSVIAVFKTELMP